MKHRLKKLFALQPSGASTTPAAGTAMAALRAKLHSLRARPLLTAALAPLLATTALTTDSSTPPAPLAPVWGHSALNTFNGNARADYSLQASPQNCHIAHRTEQKTLFRAKPGYWNGFYALAVEGGDFSRGLHKQAYDYEIRVCATDAKSSVRNYDSNARSAGIDNAADIDANISEAVHGIMHGLMVQKGLSEPAADESLFSRLNRRLTAEAVAVTAEFVVAAELAARSDTGPLRELERANTPGLRYFKHAIGFERQRHPQAGSRIVIAHSARHTIGHLLRQPEFIRANSDDILRGYLAELGIDGGKRVKTSSTFTAADAAKMGTMGRHSIADGVQPLAPKELAQLAPEIAGMVEALQQMHAQKTADKPAALSAGNPYAGIKYAQVNEQMNLSGNVYTPQQAFDRARNTRKWDKRTAFQANLFQHGIQSDYARAQAPAEARALWDSLQAMRRLSPTIMPAMLDQAGKDNVFMCYSNLPENIRGLWQPDTGVAIVTARAREDHEHAPGALRTLAHELLHMMQTANGSGSYQYSWTIEDKQTRLLASEAASSTLALLVALEYRLNGDTSLWNFAKGSEDERFADRMLAVYTAARDKGDSHVKALEAAGHEGYGLMYNRQWWLDFYNASVVDHHYDSIVNGQAKAPKGSFDIETMRLTGQISPEFNFTRNLADHPDDRMRFGNNKVMRHTFEYMHLQQLVTAYGQSHEAVAAQRKLMHATGNPYLEVDFKEFVKNAQNMPNRNLIKLLKDMAEDKFISERPAVPRPATPPWRATCN